MFVAKTSEHYMGFDTSYKSAAVNSVTWSAMDAERDDGAVYSLAYVPVAGANQNDG